MAPLKPRHGVVTLFGYGVSIRVERGHLILEGGIGPDRLRGRFPRVGHGLERVVAIGNDGYVSLAALRWLADQNAAFVMLDRDGSVLLTTGPVRSSDAKLRRAQARANDTGAAERISRALIHEKLIRQEQVARNRLNNSDAADAVADHRAEVSGCPDNRRDTLSGSKRRGGLLVGDSAQGDRRFRRESGQCSGGIPVSRRSEATLVI